MNRSFFAVASVLLAAGAFVVRAQEAPDAEVPAPHPLEAIVPALSDENFDARTGALNALDALAAEAGLPGAEAERLALCARIAGLLTSTNQPPEVAFPLVRQLQRIGADEAVPALETLLSHPDPNLRDEARQALAVNRSPAAGQALARALGMQPDARMATGLLYALGRRGDPSAVPVFVKFLDDPALAVPAAKALAAVADQQAVLALYAVRGKAQPGAWRDVLTTALFDAAGVCRRRGNSELAGRIFRELYAAVEPEPVRASALVGLVTLAPAKAADAVRQALAGPSDVLRSAAVEGALQAGEAGLFRAVADALAGAPAPIQVQMLGVLEDSGQRALAAQVIPLLAAEDGDVARAAARALGSIGDAAAAAALLQCAVANGPAAGEALVSLGQLDADGIDAQLRDAVRNGDGPVRGKAVEVIALRAGPGLVDELIGMISDADSAVAGAALKGLERAASLANLDKMVAVIKKDPSGETGKRAVGAVAAILKRSKPEDAVAALAPHLEAGPAEARVLLLKAAASTGSDAALPPIRAAAASDDGAVRDAAVRMLADWRSPAVLDDLLAIAGRPETPLNQQALAIRGVCRLAASKDLKTQVRVDACLKALAAAQRPDEKKLALGTLAGVAHPDALRAAVGLLDEEAIRNEAAEAVLALAGALALREPDAVQDAVKKLDTPEASEERRAKLRAIADTWALKDGWVSAWDLSGPHTGKGDLFVDAFPPEKKKAAVEWRRVGKGDWSEKDERMVDLNRSMKGDNRVAYLRTAFRAPKAGPIVLELGSDDGVKVWLNGEEIFAKDTSRSCKPGDDKVPVTLREGINTLQFKVIQRAGDWAAVARFVEPPASAP